MLDNNDDNDLIESLNKAKRDYIINKFSPDAAAKEESAFMDRYKKSLSDKDSMNERAFYGNVLSGLTSGVFGNKPTNALQKFADSYSPDEQIMKEMSAQKSYGDYQVGRQKNNEWLSQTPLRGGENIAKFQEIIDNQMQSKKLKDYLSSPEAQSLVNQYGSKRKIDLAGLSPEIFESVRKSGLLQEPQVDPMALAAYKASLGQDKINNKLHRNINFYTDSEGNRVTPPRPNLDPKNPELPDLYGPSAEQVTKLQSEVSKDKVLLVGGEVLRDMETLKELIRQGTPKEILVGRITNMNGIKGAQSDRDAAQSLNFGGFTDKFEGALASLGSGQYGEQQKNILLNLLEMQKNATKQGIQSRAGQYTNRARQWLQKDFPEASDEAVSKMLAIPSYSTANQPTENPAISKAQKVIQALKQNNPAISKDELVDILKSKFKANDEAIKLLEPYL